MSKPAPAFPTKRHIPALRQGAVILLLLLLSGLLPGPARAQSASPVEILVRLPASTGVQQAAEALRLPLRDIGLSVLGIYGVDVPAGQVEASLAALEDSPWVLEAEPNYPIWALDRTPNDPALPNQYALFAIRAPQGWAIENGSPNIRIAVLDSGVDFNHPDLAGKLLPGFDFINIDADPQDDNGHGTAVAGVAAAATDNSVGMAGVAWQARILPVKVLGANGNGTYADVAAGIVWASYQGVQVINLSLGGSNPSFTLEEAVEFAVSRGILLVAASGNNGSEGVLYPARYPQVVAVAATDQQNERPAFSTYGADVDLAAPGVQVYTTALGGGHSQRSGTSFAAPHVSGLAALLFSMPGQVTADQVRAAMESTALDLAEAGRDPYTGAGLIQVDAALLTIPTPPLAASAPPVAPGLPSAGLDLPFPAPGEEVPAAVSQPVPVFPGEQAGVPAAAPPEAAGPDADSDGRLAASPAGASLAWVGVGLALAGIGLAVFGSGLDRRWKGRG